MAAALSLLRFSLPPSGVGRRRRRRTGARKLLLPAAAARAEGAAGHVNGRCHGGDAELEVLYDDGFGGVGLQDYLVALKEMAKSGDGGPPRWFCPPECGKPIDRAPLLLFMPGFDGVGMGLIMQHRSLGKAFEVRCMHIPVCDRTPFEGLVQIVEKSLKEDHAVSPNRPIYLVGDLFGGCIALVAAARNPTIGLVLILVNPATYFDKLPIEPLLPLFEILPGNLHVSIPYLSFTTGSPLNMVGLNNLSPADTLEKLASTLTSTIPLLTDLAEVIPKETLLWKLKLLKSAAAHANSQLHAVEAEVLLLASNNPLRRNEANQLSSTLKKCRVRYFKNNGDALLLESGINLWSVMKATDIYRRSSLRDFVTDYLPPTFSEFKQIIERDLRWYPNVASPVTLSTLRSGKIVRGLAGIPDSGPVLLVGNHMLIGSDLVPLSEAFLKEKKTVLHIMGHPLFFSTKLESSELFLDEVDTLKIYGMTPVTARNMHRLLQRKSFLALFPGGVREACHRKGEEYKLFWPDQPEFVRLAAKCGATIVPFGAVGEDDFVELLLDYNDQQRIPFLREWMDDLNKDIPKPRETVAGEDGNQVIYLPGVLPKLPGRYYFLFGKPMELNGSKVLSDRQHAMELYFQVKSEVESLILYLKRKREQDPYRSIVQRALYHAFWGLSAEVPTFDP